MTLQSGADGTTGLGEQLRIAIETSLDSRSPVHRREQAEIYLRKHQHGAACGGGLVQHVNAVRRQGEFKQRPDKTAAGLDQREQGARRDVESREGAPQLPDDFPDKPMIAEFEE